MGWNYPEEAHERTGWMKALHNWKKDFLEWTPGRRGHEAECLETGEEPCTKGSGHASLRRELAKDHIEKSENGEKCKRSASQSESEPTRSPTEVRIKEETPSFFAANWEAPFQGPLLKEADDLSEGSSSPQWIKRRESDGKNTIVERVTATWGRTPARLPPRGGPRWGCHPGEYPSETAIRRRTPARLLPGGGHRRDCHLGEDLGETSTRGRILARLPHGGGTRQDCNPGEDPGETATRERTPVRLPPRGDPDETATRGGPRWDCHLGEDPGEAATWGRTPARLPLGGGPRQDCHPEEDLGEAATWGRTWRDCHPGEDPGKAVTRGRTSARLPCHPGEDPGDAANIQARPRTEPRGTSRLTRNERPRTLRKRTTALLSTDRTEQSKAEDPESVVCERELSARPKQKAAEKSMVVKQFLSEPPTLEASQRDWDKRRTWSIMEPLGRKPAWAKEARFLDSG